MKNLQKFNKICKDIQEIKIQGARSIAKAALQAYNLNPTKQAKKKLISLRPTEPMLMNVLDKLEKTSYKKILEHFNRAQEKINQFTLKIIKSKDVIFTHCHSTNVIRALIYAGKKGKKFEVYNTETRPLYQGRKTAGELKKAGIKVTTFVDAAAEIALTKSQGTKKTNLVFFGADAILKSGAVNKIGSGMFSEIAKNHKIPVYIIADSWKYSGTKLKLEQRNFKEIWEKAPKHIKIKNPSFELIPKENIKAIVSEFGILSYSEFINKIKNN